MFVKPCRVQQNQDFQHDDDGSSGQLGTISTIVDDIKVCLVFDNAQLPLRFEPCNTMIGNPSLTQRIGRVVAHDPNKVFELVSPRVIMGGNDAMHRGKAKGVLIKVKGRNLCASVIDLNYPLHLKTCDPFSSLQTFSMAGQMTLQEDEECSGIHTSPLNARLLVRKPPLFRLCTT